MTKQTHQFTAETEKIFNLMVHALYENKEIFLRELISNASDACDKLRYAANTNPELLGSDELQIKVSLDQEKRLITITDNGIGMSDKDLIENLGTIAKSGTQKFLEGLTGDKKKDSQLIGQFGVGFYSCFMIANNVNVISKKAGEEKGWIWNSNGDGNYTLEEAPAGFERGTQITLSIKEGEDEFLDQFRLKNIIDAYSSHIGFKILFQEDNGTEVVLNDGQAIWLKSKSEISEDDYKEFYKSISFTGDETPYLTLHNRVEGLIEYSNLLFIPSSKPFDLFHPDRQTRVKLYIKRVLISEKLEIIPQYLRFLRGVVDSNDLPLNISRETIQNNQQVQKISDSITKRTLKELAKKSQKDREDYLSFWENFGAVVKEGLCDGVAPRDEILETCLFQTNISEQPISLKEYKERMKDDQKSIYFITAENRTNALSSPQIEGFVKRGFEVIFLTDSVDDFWVNVVHEFDGTPFKSVTKAGADLESDEINSEDKSENKENETDAKSNDNNDFESLITFIKETLGDKISDAKTTARLSGSPVCLTVSEGAMDIRLERFMLENKQLPQASAKIFEVNPDHKIIQKINADVKSDNFTANSDLKAKVSETIELLFAQANIVEGEPVPDIRSFTDSLNKLIEKSLAA